MRLESTPATSRQSATQAASAAVGLAASALATATNQRVPHGEEAPAEVRDHLYLLPHGVIYTSSWITTKSTVCSPACILLSAQRQSFEVTVGKQTHSSDALVFRPMQAAGMRAENCSLASILVHPIHPEYRRFSAIATPGWQRLDRDAFSVADEMLHRACLGDLGIESAQQLLEMVVGIAVRYLPRIRSRDVRHQRLLELLQHNPHCQLGELAAALQVAPHRMPSLFARAVGLPWRSFQLWQKVRAVGVEMGSHRSLTEIAVKAGFSDSAHLSKTWHQFFGAAPSKFFNHRRVQVHYGLCSQESIRKPGLVLPPGRAERACPHCGSLL
jgi:AraC family transcriptional regulator, arabinose operon regulatory protein